MKTAILLIGLILALVCPRPVQAGGNVPPEDSGMAKAQLTAVAIAPLDVPVNGKKSGYHMQSVEATSMTASELPEGVGVGLKFTSAAEQGGGGKGDYTVAKTIDQNFKMIGGWFFISPDSLVDRIGLQVQEEGGEYFLLTFPGDFTGWKWLEGTREDFKPMAQQANQNPGFDRTLDKPIVRVSVIWMVKNDSPTVIGAAGLTVGLE